MAERIPLAARLGRALIAFAGSGPTPDSQGVSPIAREAAALRKGFATAAFDAFPMGSVTGGTVRFSPRPGDEALLRWYSENPWAHNKFLILCTAVADVTYRLGTMGARGDFVELVRTHPFWRLLEEPNEFLSGWDFLFLSTLYLRGVGEVYWRVVRNAPLGRPGELWVLPRHWVQPNRDRRTNRVLSYDLRVPGQLPGRPETVAVRDMVWLHAPDPQDPYIKGVGDALSAATEIETFEYASESDRRLMLNDARPPFWMEVPGTPNADERRAMRDDFMANYGGFWNSGTFPLLWGEAKIHPFPINKKEMDWIESQKFLRDSIIAPVHKHLVGVTEDVNRANAEAAEYIFARWQVRPEANRMARHLSKVARMFDPRAVVQADDPVPADRALQSQEARDAASGAILTVDERRARLDEAPLPNGSGKVRILPITALEVPVGEAGPREPDQPEDGERPGGGNGRPEDEAERERFGHMVGLLPSGKPGRVGEAVVKQRRPTLAELMRALPPGSALADIMLRRLLGAYIAVMEGRWPRAAAEVGIEAAFDVGHPEVARFLREEAGSRIRGIDATTLDAVRRELAEGAQAGEAIPDLARRVGEVFDDAKGHRAAVIARTETLFASNRSAFIAYGESGVVPKLEWLLAPDYTPEIDGGECEPFDGKVVEYGQEFAPGVAFPPLHPQCRCTIAPVFEGDRRLFEGEARKQHITALGRAHLRLERVYANALRRALQEQQNAMLRGLRAAGRIREGVT